MTRILAAAAAVAALAVAAFIMTTAAAGAARSAPVMLTAVVRVDGSLARGIGAVSSMQTGVDGEYRVTFSRDVSGCTFLATAGEAVPFTPGPDDAITFGVAPDNTSVNTVFLLEYDAILARDSYSSGFHLAVVCPG